MNSVFDFRNALWTVCIEEVTDTYTLLDAVCDASLVCVCVCVCARDMQLRQEFDSGVSVHLTSEHSVHDVASLLKEYLRDLPDPLLTHQLFQPFLATAGISLTVTALSSLVFTELLYYDCFRFCFTI